MGHSSCHFPRRRLGSWTRAASSLVCCASTLTRVGAERCKPSTWESRLRNPLGLGANVVVSPGSGGTGGGQTRNAAVGGQDASQPFGQAGPGSLTLRPGPQPSPWAVWGTVSPAAAATAGASVHGRCGTVHVHADTSLILWVSARSGCVFHLLVDAPVALWPCGGGSATAGAVWGCLFDLTV